jgi:hypothetical protein
MHSVKSWTHLFRQIESGAKRAEIRDLRDRDYRVGDTLELIEWDQFGTGRPTGWRMTVKITHIIDRNTPCAMSSTVLQPGYGILSIQRTSQPYQVS